MYQRINSNSLDKGRKLETFSISSNIDKKLADSSEKLSDTKGIAKQNLEEKKEEGEQLRRIKQTVFSIKE